MEQASLKIDPFFRGGETKEQTLEKIILAQELGARVSEVKAALDSGDSKLVKLRT